MVRGKYTLKTVKGTDFSLMQNFVRTRIYIKQRTHLQLTFGIQGRLGLMKKNCIISSKILRIWWNLNYDNICQKNKHQYRKAIFCNISNKLKLENYHYPLQVWKTILLMKYSRYPFYWNLWLSKKFLFPLITSWLLKKYWVC